MSAGYEEATVGQDGLCLEEALKHWHVISSSILIHKSYLSVPNLIYDAVAAVIPQNDLAVFMYLYRRVMGFTSEDQLPQAVVPYEHFANGRKTKDGRPIDFGCGLSASTIQDSLERLIASNMVVMVKRGQGGRFAVGSTWTIGEGSEWTFAPFFDAMSYAQLGRFVLAAKWGKLAPPRSLKEAKSLERCIKHRLLNTKNPRLFTLPDEWFGKAIVPERGMNEANSFIPERGTTIIPERGKRSYRSAVRDDGINPHSSRENGTLKDTIKKTLIKDTIIATDNSSELLSVAKKRGRPVVTPPSFDGLEPKDWIDKFIQHCYDGRVPGEWPQQTSSLKELRVKYPLSVVLDYYDYWKRKPFNADKTCVPRWIARDIVSWPGLDDSLEEYQQLRRSLKDEIVVVDIPVQEQEDGGIAVDEGRITAVGRDDAGATDAAEEERKRQQFAALQERFNAITNPGRGTVPNVQGRGVGSNTVVA